VKLGVLVEAEEGLDWGTWRSVFTDAERLGFESVWLSDHLQSPWAAHSTRHGLETWTALTVAAAETRRIVLGPLVSPITFRAPTVLARMSESLDALSGGRFVLGLGLGWNRAEHAAADIPFPPLGERSRRLVEAVERIRSELGERRTPLLIGGSGARATLPLVARYANAWNMTTASPADFAQASQQLDQLCLDSGRRPDEILRSAAMGLLIGRDAVDLRRRAERMRRVVPPLAEAADVLQAARDMGWLVGTPATIVEHLRELAAAGVARAILGHYDLDASESLELLADSVLPALA
jgi:alkanesulfonate monooxygenase SsuD/methylene tetrahydromethanopterin reductase-like flavin-dependent oxidoreductase (luciferase family)